MVAVGLGHQSGIGARPAGARCFALPAAKHATISRVRMIHQFLAFASEAKLLAAAGLACWIAAGLALVAERRRAARARIDAVGWVPWTGLFLTLAVIGGGLIAVSLPSIAGG